MLHLSTILMSLQPSDNAFPQARNMSKFFQHAAEVRHEGVVEQALKDLQEESKDRLLDGIAVPEKGNRHTIIPIKPRHSAH